MTHDHIPLGDQLFDQAADRARQIRDARPDQTTPGTFLGALHTTDYAQAAARATTAQDELGDALDDLRETRTALTGMTELRDEALSREANLRTQLHRTNRDRQRLQEQLDDMARQLNEMRDARDVLRYRLDQLTAENARLRRDLAAHNTHTSLSVSWHVTRSTGPTDLETRCPCPKAPCGGVDTRQTNPACDQHPSNRTKTMRQIHRADQCPAAAPVPVAPAQERDEQAEG